MPHKFLYDGVEIPSSLPLLPVRDVVVFPYMILPLFVGREQSVQAVLEAMKRDRLIFLSTQKNVEDEEPDADDIYKVGTVAMIMRMRKLPDGRLKVLAQGLTKGMVLEYTKKKPFFEIAFKPIEEKIATTDLAEVNKLSTHVKELIEKYISYGKSISPDILMVAEDIKDPGKLADLVTSHLGLAVPQSQKILEIFEPVERLQEVQRILTKEVEDLAAKNKHDPREDLKHNREQYLKEQIKAIKNEMSGGGEGDSRAQEFAELNTRITDSKMPNEVDVEARKQLKRLERMHPDASEASLVRNYIDWLLDLPWSVKSEDNIHLKKAKTILDEDHFDLEKVKERIIEFLAVRKLKNNNKGPILCLVGPPGVGKTSLGKSVARAMGRKFVRISLGGVRDEAEIRGHRRTYVGALPGRIMQGLKQAGSKNPVFILDEIDKLASDFKGDPAAALLEVLDPEQNHAFSDHYINLPFDLSDVFFIATSNVFENIPQALRDRMEVIQIPGYSEEDKVKIAWQYIINKQIKENGLPDNVIQFEEPGVRKLIKGYTREAGLRNLERKIAMICRKVAREYVEFSDVSEKDLTLVKNAPTDTVITPFPLVKVDEKVVEKMLGNAPYTFEDGLQFDDIGVVNGLAYTQYGGEILTIEVTAMKGSGGIKLTGSLGDVMKESAIAAYTYIRSQAKKYGIADNWFAKNELHLHVPAGATPKDGPSAGITIATAIISCIKGVKVRKDVAMTGEITIMGKVLPIGGLKEKSLAAMRSGITTIIISDKNEKDLTDMPEEFRNKIKFIIVNKVDDVFREALVKSVLTDSTEIPLRPKRTKVVRDKITDQAA